MFSLPMCPHCSRNAPSLGRDAQHSPTLPGPVPVYHPHPSLVVLGTLAATPLHAAIPCLSFPMARATARRVPHLSFLLLGKGKELPSVLPHVPQPSQETVMISGCAESASDFWHRRPGAIACLLPARPCSRPAVPQGRHRSGHRAATLALPHRPQPSHTAGTQISRSAGKERGQDGGATGDSGEVMELGVPCCWA